MKVAEFVQKQDIKIVIYYEFMKQKRVDCKQSTQLSGPTL